MKKPIYKNTKSRNRTEYEAALLSLGITPRLTDEMVDDCVVKPDAWLKSEINATFNDGSVNEKDD